jgi:hypothetical protein
MASVRQLKKDIDNQVFELLSDCFIYTGLHPDNKVDAVASIVERTVGLRNDLIARTNHPEIKNDPKLVRKHYRAIKSDLNSGIDKLCKELSKVSSKKQK